MANRTKADDDRAQEKHLSKTKEGTTRAKRRAMAKTEPKEEAVSCPEEGSAPWAEIETVAKAEREAAERAAQEAAARAEREAAERAAQEAAARAEREAAERAALETAARAEREAAERAAQETAARAEQEAAALPASCFQSLVVETTIYSKNELANRSALVEKLLAAESLGNAIRIQSEYAKLSYASSIAYLIKIGDVYRNFVIRNFKWRRHLAEH